MSPEQLEELKKVIKDTIHAEVSSIVESKFAKLLEKMDDTNEDVNSGFKDMAEDRKDFAFMKTSQGTVEKLMRELLDIIDTQTRRITKTVEHKADQAIENSAQAVAESVEPMVKKLSKSILNGTLFSDDKRWWQFWKKKKKPILDNTEIKVENKKDKKK